MSDGKNDFTITVPIVESTAERERQFKEILDYVYQAMKEKGTNNPENNLCGYFVSGDPTYITKHKQARILIGKADRYELLIYLIKNFYKDRQNI